MICPNCQTENRDGAKFCDECGTRIELPAEAVPADVEEPVVLADDIEEPESATEAASADEKAEAVDAGSEAQEVVETQQESPADVTAVIPVQTDPALTGLDVSVPEVFDVTPINLGNKDVDSAARTMQIPVIPAEKIASEGYAKPENAWKSGGTLEMPRVEGVEPANNDFRAPDPNAKKLRRKQAKELRKQQKIAEREARRMSGEPVSGGKGKVIGVIAAIIVLVGAIGIGTYSMEIWGGKTVPSCQGKSVPDATLILENAGFTVRVNEVPSDDTEGLVLLTDPASGARVPGGSEVVVHVAVSRVIPEVIGLTEADALALIAKSGYTNVGEIIYEKSNELDGVVTAIDPVPGTKTKSGTPITVTVAEAYKVPDVAGMEEYDAIEACKEAGYEVKVNHVRNYEVPEGHVISSNPEAGTKLESGSYVALTIAISRGAALEDKSRTYLKTAELTKDGTACKVINVDEVSYVNDGVVRFTVTARPYASLFGQVVYGPEQIMSGSITFNSSDELVSVKVG